LLFLLVLTWADGGPGTSFKRAWLVGSKLTGTEIVLIALLVLLVTLLLMPFQLSLVRLLEGAWPTWLGGGLSVARQRRRKQEIVRLTALISTDEEEVWRAGRAGSELRSRYPLPHHLVRSTRLGNILAAMEDRAGRDYGLDAVVAWPRLYPSLGPTLKAVVDDRRNTLDYLSRLAVTGALTAVAAAIILRNAGWWVTLAIAPVAVAVLAYLGALRAALAYGETVQTAFDIHHWTFGTTFGLALPTDPGAERKAHEQLCDLWRQGIPPTFGYAPTPAATSEAGEQR
jgi:hypothetical protein